MKTFTTAELERFQEALLAWYAANRRLLPWRGDSIGNQPSPPVTPYGIWISEIMLQQTRVETVVSYWTKWMCSFPNISVLASATQEQINSHWSGLGYYRRAKAISDCAKVLVEKYNSELPQDIEHLLSLPGIGPYTAGAISSIAFSNPVPAVDGNVIRVFSRLFAISEEGPTLERTCRTIGSNIIDRNSPGNFNQALMELGATICKPSSPSCSACPVQDLCRANLLVTGRILDIEDLQRPTSVTEFPRKAPKKPPVEMKFIILALRHPAYPSKYLFSRRPSRKPVVRSLGRCPIVSLLDFDSLDIQIHSIDEEPIIHIFSHQKHHMYVGEAVFPDGTSCGELRQPSNEERLLWMDQEELSQRGITTGVKKIFTHLKKRSCGKGGANTRRLSKQKVKREQGELQLTLDSSRLTSKRRKEEK